MRNRQMRGNRETDLKKAERLLSRSSPSARDEANCGAGIEPSCAVLCNDKTHYLPQVWQRRHSAVGEQRSWAVLHKQSCLQATNSNRRFVSCLSYHKICRNNWTIKWKLCITQRLRKPLHCPMMFGQRRIASLQQANYLNACRAWINALICDSSKVIEDGY